MLCLTILRVFRTENAGLNWCSCGWPCETWQAVIFWSRFDQSLALLTTCASLMRRSTSRALSH